MPVLPVKRKKPLAKSVGATFPYEANSFAFTITVSDDGDSNDAVPPNLGSVCAYKQPCPPPVNSLHKKTSGLAAFQML